MERRAKRWQAVAVAAAMVGGAPGAWAHGPEVAGQTADGTHPSSARGAGSGGAEAPLYSADVVVDESVVDAEGVVVEQRPQTRYRMSVRRTARGSRTELVYPDARLFPKGPLVDPRSGQRVVIDGDLSNGRVYDAAGRLILGPPPEADRGGASEPGRDTGLVLADHRAGERRADFVKRFGPALGRIGGRERFLSTAGDTTTETLVDPATALPMEINVARGGALEHRTSIAYGRMPGGRWYVARTRSEVALSDGRGRRFVSERTHLNVVSQEGR